SAVERSPSHATALVPEAAGPCEATSAAGAAITALRTSVVQPIGSEESTPKQWHSGFLPRIRATVIAAAKTPRRASAPSEAHHALGTGTSATATASSASGRANATGATSGPAAPKPDTARFEP